MSQTKQNFFSGWRFRFFLIVGIGISIIFLYFALTRTEFHKVDFGNGDYSWVDKNHNKKIETASEFIYKPQAGNFKKQNAISVLSTISWNGRLFTFLILAALAVCGRDLAYMWRIRLLSGKDLTFKRSFFTIMLWEFASTLAPGLMSGVAVAVFILKREGISYGKASSMVIITAFLDNLFYIIMIPVLLFFIGSKVMFPPQTESSIISVFWTAYFIFLTLTLFLGITIFFQSNLIKTCLTGLTKLPILNRFSKRAISYGTDLENASLNFKSKGVLYWFKLFIATFLSWTCRFLVINFILQAFLNLTLFSQILVYSKQFVLWMLLRISPTPGGSGVAEWAFEKLLSEFSSSLILLASLAIVWRLFSYFPYLILGGFLLPSWLKSTSNKG